MGVKQPLSSQRKELLKEVVNGLEREVQSLGNRLVCEVSVDGIETELETGHLLECGLVALGSDVDRIGDRRVRDT